MSGVNEIRSTFLNFFAENGHEIVPSSPLVPRNDPTLMFTNAGMVQFKNVFTGVEKRPYQRATTSQKCVRAGGKHNDLDNVGYTARHHTFFEMLGNFSFGDYFKDRAIELAWNLVTKEFGLPKDKLTATVYHRRRRGVRSLEEDRGPAGDPHHPHRRLGQFLADGRHRALRSLFGNLLSTTATRSGAARPARPEAGRRPLHRDLESRVHAVRAARRRSAQSAAEALDRHRRWAGARRRQCCRASTTHYDIDLFVALIRAIADPTGADPQGPQKASLRVIADHLRASSFLIADGVLPSNEGRGYVLRRIMRRAMRHAQLLGARDPLMHRLVWALVREMGQAYPELVRAENLIEETLRLEETRFRKTLERGLSILDEKSAA